MPERTGEFAYTYRESVRWLLENSAETGKLPLAKAVVNEHVERMRQAGWNAHEIMQRCADFGIFPQGDLKVPLTQIVYFDHPVISELPDNEVRAALYRMAALYAAESKADLFADRLLPDKAYLPKYVHERNIRAMEQFMNRLSVEATPPAGLRKA